MPHNRVRAPTVQVPLLPERFGRTLLSQWPLDPQVRFLNHGSFGAAPHEVLAAQARCRQRMERQPVRFMVDELPPTIRAAADRLGPFLGCPGRELAFATNATEAINAILGAIAWRPGDEIVLADHAYPAIRNAVSHVAGRHGLRVMTASIPFPIASTSQILDAYVEVLGAATRLVIVDHVFSPLALVSPVAEIVAACAAKKIPVLIDGAHAPGMLPLDLRKLGADWYVGNAHKWMFAPRGCAFLHRRDPDLADLHPAVISNHYGAGFPAEFDWIGTRDYTPWLALPAALDFLARIGIEAYRAYCRTLAAEAAAMLADQWKTRLPAPAAMSAAMVTVALPARIPASLQVAADLRRRLVDAFGVEVPVLCFNGQLWVRVSAQIYNDIDDYRVLADAVSAIVRE